MRARPKKALIAVAVLVVFVFGVCVISLMWQKSSTDSGDAAQPDTSYTDLLTNSVLAGTDVYEQLTASGFVALDTTSAPDWFEGEIMPLNETNNALASPDFSTIGFLSDGSATDVLQDLTKLFTARGWQGFESGISGTATYTKTEGECSWMMVTCMESKGATSVVVRIQHR